MKNPCISTLQAVQGEVSYEYQLNHTFDNKKVSTETYKTNEVKIHERKRLYGAENDKKNKNKKSNVKGHFWKSCAI